MPELACRGHRRLATAKTVCPAPVVTGRPFGLRFRVKRATKPALLLVSPPERVLYIKNYTSSKGNRSSIIFLETPKVLRRKTLPQVRKTLGHAAALLRPKSNLTLLRDAQLNHRLHQLWPNLS